MLLRAPLTLRLRPTALILAALAGCQSPGASSTPFTGTLSGEVTGAVAGTLNGEYYADHLQEAEIIATFTTLPSTVLATTMSISINPGPFVAKEYGSGEVIVTLLDGSQYEPTLDGGSVFDLKLTAVSPGPVSPVSGSDTVPFTVHGMLDATVPDLQGGPTSIVMHLDF